jgi:hypothetical protein
MSDMGKLIEEMTREGGPFSEIGSCALDASCVAAALCVVHLKIAGLWIGEETLEHIGSLAAVADFGIDHHVLRVEGANCQEPRGKHVRDGVDSIERSISDPAHIDGMGRAVWSLCRLMLEVEKKKFLAELSVLHAHPAWHTWIIGNDAASAPLMELGIRHSE